LVGHCDFHSIHLRRAFSSFTRTVTLFYASTELIDAVKHHVFSFHHELTVDYSSGLKAVSSHYFPIFGNKLYTLP